MGVSLYEVVAMPVALMIVLMIANTLSSSNDVGLKQAGEYGKYLVFGVGAAWLASIPWRLRQQKSY